ncbi:GNAT family N-acetyltransferase [Ahrensia sp. R2A130]|uniref:GNAT family N-acetyltransferase n=1 Tax=Ahrensia sp. R2A130 TaxID=744979 RepID=UPI0001E0BCF4|nr:GNAT family N-acetyltransferase [Ahrensia sp. R2A130]EFL87595.1 acetyltransferase [Ahrensia sp. R2A130]
MKRATIRNATPDDMLSCADIINDWIDATEWMKRGPSRETVESGFTHAMLDHRTLFVAQRGDGIVGYILLETSQNYIHGFYVAPTERRRGTGRALLKKAKAGHPFLTLFVSHENTDAVRFYSREGFREISNADDIHEDYRPDIFMRWDKAA